MRGCCNFFSFHLGGENSPMEMKVFEASTNILKGGSSNLQLYGIIYEANINPISII